MERIISAAESFDLISFIILPFVFLLMSGCRPQVTHYLLRGHQFSAQPLAFSPDGRWLASTDNSGTGESSGLWLWAVDNPSFKPRFLPNHHAEVWQVAFSPNGHWLLSAGTDHSVRLWSVDNPDLAPQRLEVDNNSARLARFTPGSLVSDDLSRQSNRTVS
ncbi:MAG: hypothetical protein KDI79_20755 [Anaerolineae bacterium]|nr:hypothetical protein [Anaerolineae bacterium]